MTEPAGGVIVLDDATPGDRLYWTTPEQDTLQLDTDEVIRIFYGASREWFYDVLRRYPETHVPKVDLGSTRMWSLWDIEKFTHSLCYSGVLSPYRARLVLLIVKAIAQQHGMIRS